MKGLLKTVAFLNPPNPDAAMSVAQVAVPYLLSTPDGGDLKASQPSQTGTSSFSPSQAQIDKTQQEQDPFLTNIDVTDPATGAQELDELGLNPNLQNFLSGTTYSVSEPTNAFLVYEESLLDGNLNVVVDPGVSADIEVGSGGTATIVGGTDSTLNLWYEKNVFWENDGGGNTISFVPEVSTGLDGLAQGPTQELLLNLLTGQGVNPYGGTLDVSGVDAVVGYAPADYIVANNDGDFIEAEGGTNVVIGGTGNDKIIGALGGNNLIVAGSGTSALSGSEGYEDIFVYNNGVDNINYFNPALNQTFPSPDSILDLTAVEGVTSYAQAIGDASQNGANTVFNFGPNESVTLNNVSLSDLTAADFVFSPIVPFVSAAAGVAVAGEIVPITLTVSDAVTVNTANGTPSLTLNDGGTAIYDASASNPAGHLLVFNYTVGAADATTNLEITGVNTAGGVIATAGGQAVNFADALDVTLGVQVGTPVTVSAVSVSATGEVDTGGTVNITLEMNEAVSVQLGLTFYHETGTVFGLALSDGAIANYNASLSDPAAGDLVFTDLVESADHATNLSISGILGLTYVAGISPDLTTVKNAAGYAADFGGGLVATGLAINPPVYVSSLSTDAAPSPTGFGDEADAGQTLHIALSLNEAVTVNAGTPSLQLSDGETATYDAIASSPTTLVFDDVVGATDHSPGNSLVSVALNGATVAAAGGVAADFAGVAGDSLDVAINSSPLSVESVTAGTLTLGSFTDYTVTLIMSEPVVNASSASEDLLLNNGDIAQFYSVSGNQLIFVDSVSPTGGDPTEDSNISVAGIERSLGNRAAVPFEDANGYAANLSAAIGVGTGVVIGDPLYVTSLATNVADGESQGGQPVTVTVGMSEAVTITGGTLSLTYNDGGDATYDAAASTLASGLIAFSYTPPADEEFSSVGINSINLNGATVTDAGGNAADFSSLIDTPLQLQIGPATVVTAASTVIGTLAPGESTNFVLVMSQNVNINTAGGSPTLTLSNGETATYDAALTAITASDGPNSVGQIVFDYTAGSGGATPDLSIASVNLNGAVITDVQSGLNADFSAVSSAFLGTSVACFAQGTLLQTPSGEVAVEALAVGDEMQMARGGSRRVVWLGHRRVNCLRHPHPEAVWPVCVAAGAFGMGVPRRPLFLSPDHAVFCDGLLVPIKRLINGTSIAQMRCDEITYWHVELERHDVLLAEGLACESYLETGCRSAFAGGPVVQITPEFVPADPEVIWEVAGCAPLRIAGPVVERMDARLRRRAGIKRAGGKRRPARGAVEVDLRQLVQAKWYLRANPDVAAAGMDAVTHYEHWGRYEGRLPCGEVELVRALGLIDPLTAAVTMPDVALAGIAFSAHFCAHGWREGRRANPYFDASWYCALAEVPDGMNPLVHYVLVGDLQGLAPSRYFDPTWYRRRYGLAESVCALAHYLKYRRTGWYSPLPEFNVIAYRNSHKMLAERDPFAYYICERRSIDLHSQQDPAVKSG